VPFSVKKNVMGFPIVPRATKPSPVLFLPQWSAHFRMVTGASLLVISRGGIHHPRSPRMAQTPEIMTRFAHSMGVQPDVCGLFSMSVGSWPVLVM
jgi:hypothetical protein